MKRAATILAITFILAATLAPAFAVAQDIMPSRDEVIALTSGWEGERYPDGRPKVPDSILERMKRVKLADAWSVLRGKGYNWQYEGDWKFIHLDETTVMAGRALTATFMPIRADLDTALTEKGLADGHVGGRNSWPIDMLQMGDVYVADAFGSVLGGPMVGGNLATAIMNNSGNGVVFDGSVRDIEQMADMGFPGWVKDWHPSYNYDHMLVAINRPTRIGVATVLPGDVVLANRQGVLFIPPQFAEEVCKTAELIELRDLFGFERIKEGVYTPGQVDQRWDDAMEKDFSEWLNDHMDELPVPKEQIQDLLKERTW